MVLKVKNEKKMYCNEGEKRMTTVKMDFRKQFSDPCIFRWKRKIREVSQSFFSYRKKEVLGPTLIAFGPYTHIP
jgi:hypothetical protein